MHKSMYIVIAVRIIRIFSRSERGPHTGIDNMRYVTGSFSDAAVLSVSSRSAMHAAM